MSNKPFRMEYALGYQADTGVYLPIGSETHPWESVMQAKLAEHANDPDWECVTVICRPVIEWAKVESGCPR